MGSAQSSVPAPASPSPESCPVRRAPPASAPIDECPVRYKHPVQYNVKSQVIDPANQMPASPSQQLAPGQTQPLPTERVQSGIPKGGALDATWLYPSPQMFWNAMARKNKTEGASERDMATVVAVHNNMNENTWAQVLAWEQLQPAPANADVAPKLLRFQGRPDELSPKAYLKTLLGHPRPFDRHDWVVDRGGWQVRYVIDYYSDESEIDRDALPASMRDASALRSIRVDVRPALDSMEALLARLVRMPLRVAEGRTIYSPPPFFAPSPMVRAQQLKSDSLRSHWADIQTRCASAKEAVKSCKDDAACSVAAVNLQRCVGGVVCPQIAADFDLCVSSGDVARTESAYSALTGCIDAFELDSRS